MKTYEEQQTLVSQLNVMDDLFFQKMVEDMDVCEEMLRVLLTMPALKMAQTQPQRFIRNVDAHSVVLDLLCEDETGNIITVEVQKTDNCSCRTPYCGYPETESGHCPPAPASAPAQGCSAAPPRTLWCSRNSYHLTSFMILFYNL